MPAARAAASREPPSSARASIRRAARASRHRAASRRSSPAPGSRRVIATTIGPLPTGPYRRINRQGPRDAPGTRPVRNNGRWYKGRGATPRSAEMDVAGKKGRGPVRLVEPESLLGLSLGDVLLGLMETGEGQPDPAPGDTASTAVHNEPALRLRMPDGRVEREPLLGGFWRHDRTGGLTAPRVVTRREGKALACKLYRVGGDRALYAGVLKTAGARAFVEAAPGTEFRYRNARLCKMTAG